MDKLMKTSKKLDTFFKVLQKIIKITMIVSAEKMWTYLVILPRIYR